MASVLDCADAAIVTSVALDTSDYAEMDTILIWFVMSLGLMFAAALIALATTLLGRLTGWEPGAASGSFAAIGIGLLGAVIVPLIGLLILPDAGLIWPFS